MWLNKINITYTMQLFIKLAGCSFDFMIWHRVKTVLYHYNTSSQRSYMCWTMSSLFLNCTIIDPNVVKLEYNHSACIPTKAYASLTQSLFKE